MRDMAYRSIDFDTLKSIKKALLIYFSGTGGTARAAGYIERFLKSYAIDVCKEALDSQINNDSKASQVDLLLVVYPVHAFDAPEPVYEWIKKSGYGNNIPAAVISVSGGGEVWPNTACRFGVIRALEHKGFRVFYEQMLVMPSNWIIATHEQLSVHLLKVLPTKLHDAVSEILSGVVRRTKPDITALLVSFIFRLEKPFANIFAKDIRVSATCTGCGWCAKNCPRRNIEMADNRPSFGRKCVACLRCIYGCPQKSLSPTRYKFVTLKEGYSLTELEKRAEHIELEPVERYAKGYLYAGVKKYLMSSKP